MEKEVTALTPVFASRIIGVINPSNTVSPLGQWTGRYVTTCVRKNIIPALTPRFINLQKLSLILCRFLRKIWRSCVWTT
jgi:hypothetical protein